MPTHSSKTSKSFHLCGRTVQKLPKYKNIHNKELFLEIAPTQYHNINKCAQYYKNNYADSSHRTNSVLSVFLAQEGSRDEHVAEVRSHDTMRVQCVLDQERPIICYSPGI